MIYNSLLCLASFLSFDERLRTVRREDGEPLAAEIWRILSEAVSLTAIWLRHFAAARDLDDALTQFSVRESHDALGEHIIRTAQNERLVSEEDADIVRRLLIASARGHDQSAKAARRGVLSVRNLLYKCGTLVAQDYLRIDGSDNRRPLLQHIRSFLNVAEPYIDKFISGLPADTKFALGRLVTEVVRSSSSTSKEAQDVFSSHPTLDAGGETAQTVLEIDNEAVKALVLRGISPPTEWVPAIVELDLSGSSLRDLKPIRALTSLQKLNLSRTKVTDVSLLSGLACLETLDLSLTNVVDVSPLSNLAKLKDINLRDTQVLEVDCLSSIVGLERLVLRNTQVRELGQLAHMVQLEIQGGPAPKRRGGLAHRSTFLR
jgi:hypothetical protein